MPYMDNIAYQITDKAIKFEQELSTGYEWHIFLSRDEDSEDKFTLAELIVGRRFVGYGSLSFNSDENGLENLKRFRDDVNKLIAKWEA